MTNRERIDKLRKNKDLPDEDFLALLEPLPGEDLAFLRTSALEVCRETFGRTVYLRGLIEFSSFCKNDCLYCGLRRSNTRAERIRLDLPGILACCARGYELGLRTFVLQSGEDPFFTDERLCAVISAIKEAYPHCALTLSVGERSHESYAAFKRAGADRYLLRHETADLTHYGALHPAEMSGSARQDCLFDLKALGYQVGCGMMVGSPYQEKRHLLSDLRFMQRLGPHMIGIGPFLPHRDTPFADRKSGALDETLKLLALLRLMFPRVLLPATTALGTLDPMGREKGLLSGANVVMPNLTPAGIREKYLLYDGKIGVEDQAEKCCRDLKQRLETAGFEISVCRGDAPDWSAEEIK